MGQHDRLEVHTERCRDRLLELVLDAGSFVSVLDTAGQNPRSAQLDYLQWLHQHADEERMSRRRHAIELTELYLDLCSAVGEDGTARLKAALGGEDLLGLAVVLMYGPNASPSTDAQLPAGLPR